MKLNYFVAGTNNLNAATRFYDALFEQTEYQQILATDRMTFWQGQDKDSAFAIAIPFNKESATYGNGTMFGFGVDCQQQVTRLYSKVIELGGRCEGQPGERGPRFTAYVRDLDNNKLCFSALLHTTTA